MMNKAFKAIAAALVIFFSIFPQASVLAAHPDLWPVSPSYYYYDSHNSIPTVAGPYPRYYLVQNQIGTDFMHDDFDHYDSFIDYRDLEVFYPDRGRIDILRNPNANVNIISVNRSKSVFGQHVIGFIPGGGIYRKHYMHEHPWELEEDYYARSNQYHYSYYSGNSYRTASTPARPCQSRSICQATHCC